MHKGSGLDRRALRTAKSKGDPIEKKIEGAMAMLLDELSMVPPDVYHAGAFRFAMTRQEHWRLEIVRYLEQWFGKVPIGVQLADFLQLRPTACLSLCEWQDAQRATDAAVVPESDNGVEEAAAERTSNASELGRLAFKSSLQRVVHFTGSGRFSQCASGQQLVKILLSMREGRPLEDGLWEALEARSIGGEQLLENQMLQTRLLNFGVGTSGSIAASPGCLGSSTTIHHVVFGANHRSRERTD